MTLRSCVPREVLRQVEHWLDVLGLKYIPWQLDVNVHAQLLQDVLYMVLCTVAPRKAGGPISSYVPKEAWQLRERRQRFKCRTRSRKEVTYSAILRGALHRWRSAGQGLSRDLPLTCKITLLYELAAAAVKISTGAIKRMIGECKNAKLGDIARQVGKVTPAAIFQRLREMNLGSRQPRRWKNALPKLCHANGEKVQGRLELDAAWMCFFGDMEMGEQCDTESYIRRTVREEFYAVDFDPDPLLLPDVGSIEDILRTTKVGKAAGLDRIPGELLRGCPGRMAAILQPLFTKAVLRGRQPVQWRGGLLVEALKKAGMEASLNGHRSLFVGSVVGKAYHRYVRQHIISRTEDVLRDTHFGARRGSTVVQASHIAVLYESAQCQKRRSSAVLFVDAKSAYYCVIRQMVYGSSAGQEDAVIMKIMHHFGLPATVWNDLLSVIRDGGLFQRHGLSDHVRMLTKDLHDASFFVTRHATGATVVETQLGSRPGESIADIIFAWILHRVLDGIEEKLCEAGCGEYIQAGDEKNLWDHESGECVPILGPIWADDGAFMTSHEDAKALWARATVLATAVLQCFFESGLTPNLEKGKTEMLISFRGARSRMMQTEIFGSGERCMLLDVGAWGQQRLRLTTEYVHLGCALDRGATMKLETTRRLSKAQGAFQEHRRRIYQNTRIPIPVRGALFAAMVEATMFNLEIWNCSTGPAWTKLLAGHGKLLRRLLARDFDSETLLSFRLSDMVCVAQHPPLDIIARGRRLRYMITVARGAPPALWALLHYEEKWQAQCCEDFRWLRWHDVKEWPEFEEHTWPEWWHCLRDAPEAFRRAVGRATRASTAVFALQGAFSRVHDALKRDAYRFCPQAFALAGTEIWVCGPCRKVFRRKAHLACHLFKTHRRQAESRFFLKDAVCRACGKDFQTEDRLQRHLGYSAVCWRTVMQLGSTCSVATPGIGSREWKTLRREQPILHPPLPADVFFLKEAGANSGETPGEALIRRCAGDLGEAVGSFPTNLTEEDFTRRCVAVLLRFPLYPSEMRAAVMETIADVHMCVEAELLDWDIKTVARVGGWLRHYASCLCGRWLCEWASISTDVDGGPCQLLSDGVQRLLEQRSSSLCDLQTVISLCDNEADVERTQWLGRLLPHRTLRWCELLEGSSDFRGVLLLASFVLPGEAVAGGSKSPTALDASEVKGCFSLASALIDTEPRLRAVWRAFLAGARVQLQFSGSPACGAVARTFSLLADCGWHRSEEGSCL